MSTPIDLLSTGATCCMVVMTVVMIVLLCLSLIGIPFIPIVLYVRKVGRGKQ